MKINKARYYRRLGGLTTLALVVLLLTTLCGCTKIQSQTEGSLQASTQPTESSKGYERISQDTRKVTAINSGAINALAFSPDGKQLAVASSQGLWVYDTTADTPATLLSGHEGEVLTVAWSDNQTLASGGEDKSVRLWNVNIGDLLLDPLKGHEGKVNVLAFSPDGKMLASSSGLKKDYHSGLFEKPLDLDTLPTDLTDREEFRKYVDKLLDRAEVREYFDESGERNEMVARERDNFDGTIRLWNSDTGELLQIFEVHATTLAFFADGKTKLVSVSSLSDVSVPKDFWYIRTGEREKRPLKKEFKELKEERKTGPFGRSVYTTRPPVVLASDGRKLAHVRVDRPIGQGKNYEEVKVKITTDFDPPIYINLELPVTTLVFSHNGNYLATAGGEATIQLWNVKMKQPLKVKSLTAPTEGITALAFSNSGMFAAGSCDGKIALWKPK